ncbi:MAG TPA: BRCT domain-containing protein [Arthrobacter sp.]
MSKSTSLLVCGEPGSAKWNKAQELGIKIVTPEEFAQMLADEE